jgi:hypothetical protein
MDRLLVLCATMVFFCVSHADAQCLAYQQGTVGCPNYGAPAATAVPGPSMDGGVATVTTGQPAVTLFGGRVPPNGFIVRVFTTNGYPVPNGVYCFVNDNGPAGSGVGFYMPPDQPTPTMCLVPLKAHMDISQLALSVSTAKLGPAASPST